MASQLAQTLISYAPVPLDLAFGSCARDAFGILMYHRVCPRFGEHPACPWSVTPKRLRAQLRGLLRREFQAWPLSRVLEYRRQGETIPDDVFVVTFDDGYANNYHWGLPILRELDVPATVFAVTSQIDSREPFPFDDWTMAGADCVPRESWLPLSTQQCRELLDSGLVELGAHTHTHARLADVPAMAEIEIETSLAELHERFGLEQAAFAFPYGSVPETFDAALVERLQAAGMRCALTTQEEPVGPKIPSHRWGRFTAHGSDTSTTLAAKLDGHYTFLRDAWRTLRGS